MKVLVTGATGFIGRCLVAELIDRGHTIRILSRKQQIGIETVVCNLGVDTIPVSALDSVDVVFHLAGVAHDMRGEASVEAIYRAVNVDATVRLASLSVQSSVKKFIYMSSVKAGGVALSGHCMSEEDQGEPEDIYGKTKREAELKLLEIMHCSSMQVSIVRPALVYGPAVKGNLRMMMSGVEKGWFPPLPEVNNRRSMIHLDDLVRALLLVVEDDRANGNIYIATDGQQHSSREIYEVMCQILNKPISSWNFPKFLFKVAASMNSRIRYKVDKLLGDECYTSGKLQSLGFRARRSLREMNESIY